MPVLANHRHEKFAQLLVTGLTQEEAHARAGYKRSRHNAARLAAQPDIKARVAELSAAAAKEVGLTKEWVIQRLMEHAEVCLGNRTKKIKIRKPRSSDVEEVEAHLVDPASANRALELLGKEIGMFVERSERTNTNYNISDEPLSQDEWVSSYADGATAH